jgi:16S rRNA (cytidine1402-2'-O)-methyltransferase
MSESRDGGRVIVISTPIGNLGDLAPRAAAALADADVIYSEDTRRTRALLSALGLRAGNRLVSLHEHNEASRVPEVLAQLQGSAVVALVSDAGTPLVSDPGSRLVAAALSAGFSVTVVPGPSAVLAALVVSGLPTERFCVEGFLPRKGAERREVVDVLAGERRTTVFFESPGRLAATLAELAGALGGDRRICVARELTKLHEEIWRGSLEKAVTHFAEREVKGEVVLVLAGAPEPAAIGDDDLDRALRTLLEGGHSARDAAHEVAQHLGVPRRRAYNRAITLAGDATSA